MKIYVFQNDYIKTEKYRFRLSSFIEPRLLVFTLLACLFSTGNGLVSAFLALIGDERSIVNIGLHFTVFSAFMVFVRPFSGKLLSRSASISAIPSRHGWEASPCPLWDIPGRSWDTE